MVSMGGSGVFGIGELARRTGLTTRTIRFYSDEGLLPPTDRTHAGYRRYDAAALARLELLKTLRELGIGLTEANEALAGNASVAELASRHVALLDEQLRVLRLRRAVLRAVAKNGSRLDEVRLMKDLAAMTDDERNRLIDEFWDEVNAGLDINPEFEAGMRSAKPGLPDDPSPEQLQAWIELAELVQDADFRRRIREMSEFHAQARADGQDMSRPDERTQEQWNGWLDAAAAAMAAGNAPDSPAGSALAEQVSTELDQPAAEFADQYEVGLDPRAERYWQLLATINAWPPVPTKTPAATWLIAALRALP